MVSASLLPLLLLPALAACVGDATAAGAVGAGGAAGAVGAGGAAGAVGAGGAGGVGGAGGAGPVLAAQRSRVRARPGGVAELHCTALRLGDRAVSWVRSRDLQILSHGGAVFTSDARVSLRVAAPHHVLVIQDARPGDAGRYECQLNTEPKTSLFFDLVVEEVNDDEPEVMQRDQVEAEEEPAGPGAGRAATAAATSASARVSVDATLAAVALLALAT